MRARLRQLYYVLKNDATKPGNGRMKRAMGARTQRSPVDCPPQAAGVSQSMVVIAVLALKVTQPRSKARPLSYALEATGLTRLGSAGNRPRRIGHPFAP